MKQKLSLFALAFIAVCAFAAQKVFKAPADGEPEKIVFENGVTYTDFQEFTTENVKLVLGKDTQWKKNVAKSFKGDYMTPFSQTVLEEDESGEMVEKSRLIYLVGNKNPKDDLDNTGGGFDGTAGANHKLPQSGTYYMITPAVNGTVLLGMVLNENKEFFIIDATDAVETPILDGDGNPTGASTLNVVNDNAVFQHDAFKVCAEDGTELEYMDAAPAEGNALIDGGKGGVKVVTKITGTAEFDVQANHTYYVFCTGSKLTIVGLLFTPSAAAEPEDIEISPASGDISAALEEASAGKLVRNITINLTEGAAYTMSAPIVAPAGLVINGNGATIDASAVDAALFQLSTTPAVEAVNDYFRVDNMKIADVTITGVKHSIIYDNNTKYCVVDLTIENALIGLATESVSNDALIAFQAGGVKDFTIKNSTVYGNAVANYFIRYNNNSRLDRYGFDKETEFQTMTYLNNTFYKVIKDGGQWGNYNGIGGQVFSKFDIQKNIWVDCSTDIIRRLAGGRFNGSNPMTFDLNTYYYNGTDRSANEASYDNSGNILTTDPKFADAANADFHIGSSTDQAQYQTGDPRWLVEYVAPVTENVLWSSEEPVAADWGSDAIKIAPEKLADAKVGDKVHVKVATVNTGGGEWGAQVALKSAAWTDLEGGVPVGNGDKEEAVFVLTGDILSLVKADGGLQISGNNYTTKEVTLEVTEITGSDASIWVGKDSGKPTINVNHFLNANSKAGVKAGDIIRIAATKVADGYIVLSYNGEDTGWSWVNYEGYELTETETGFDVVVTEGMIDQLKKDGLIINQEGYELTQVEIVEGVINGISNINVAENNDGKWYNLQGVQVKAPTKGIFIHNGKKVILK